MTPEKEETERETSAAEGKEEEGGDGGGGGGRGEGTDVVGVSSQGEESVGCGVRTPQRPDVVVDAVVTVAIVLRSSPLATYSSPSGFSLPLPAASAGREEKDGLRGGISSCVRLPTCRFLKATDPPPCSPPSCPPPSPSPERQPPEDCVARNTRLPSIPQEVEHEEDSAAE